MENYAVLSIETHLFFARIMKEHALFLEAGFPCREEKWIQKADWFREQFEELLWQVVRISDGMAGSEVLESGEVVTEFTLPAERKTQCLTGIAIDSALTEAEKKLRSGCSQGMDRGMFRTVHLINRRALSLLEGLIDFKENIIREVQRCSLYTSNYPLLIQHILREARLYRSIIQELMQNRQNCRRRLVEKEEFWNQIMMEHALFIRGLLDPSEEELIGTADEFARTYEKLLEEAKMQDCRAAEGMMANSQNNRANHGMMNRGQGCRATEGSGNQAPGCQLKDGLTVKSLEETKKYRDFKTAGAEGILECEIASVILPLLADHVLREANHYIRILETGYTG